VLTSTLAWVPLVAAHAAFKPLPDTGGALCTSACGVLGSLTAAPAPDGSWPQLQTRLEEAAAALAAPAAPQLLPSA
jgi:hypothetical protein